jgi:hypothetical protein
VPLAKEHEHRAAAHVAANSLGHDSRQSIEAPAQIDGLKTDEDFDAVGNHWTPNLASRASTSSSTIASVSRSNPLGTTSRIPQTSTAIAAPPHNGKSIDSSAVYGMGKRGDEFVIILDIDKVFPSGDLKEMAARLNFRPWCSEMEFGAMSLYKEQGRSGRQLGIPGGHAT